MPDRLTLSEVLEQFRQVHEDFAVIVNEYSLVVGVVTLNDVMSTVMGDLVGPDDEEQIVQRDADSWLIDGVTPIEDVLRALALDALPTMRSTTTLAGFLMVMLRRVPRRTDSVSLGRLQVRGAGRGPLPHRPGDGLAHHAQRWQRPRNRSGQQQRLMQKLLF